MLEDPPGSGRSGPRRLLVVDDEPAIVRAIAAYFGSMGFAVASARSVSEAESALVPGAFDAIITDLRIDSPFDGLRVARRALEACPGARVLILTGFGTPELELEARRLGAVVLHKPLPLASLARAFQPGGVDL